MDSNGLAKYGYRGSQGGPGPGDWQKLQAKGNSSLLAKVPLQHAVFMVRTSNRYLCKKRSSDLIYIGSSTTSPNLRKHLARHIGKAQVTGRSWSRDLRKGEPLEVAWMVTDSKREALSLKRDLLFWFKHGCGQLPKYNRQLQAATLPK